METVILRQECFISSSWNYAIPKLSIIQLFNMEHKGENLLFSVHLIIYSFLASNLSCKPHKKFLQYNPKTFQWKHQFILKQ